MHAIVNTDVHSLSQGQGGTSQNKTFFVLGEHRHNTIVTMKRGLSSLSNYYIFQEIPRFLKLLSYTAGNQYVLEWPEFLIIDFNPPK